MLQQGCASPSRFTTIITTTTTTTGDQNIIDAGGGAERRDEGRTATRSSPQRFETNTVLVRVEEIKHGVCGGAPRITVRAISQSHEPLLCTAALGVKGILKRHRVRRKERKLSLNPFHIVGFKIASRKLG